MVVSDGTALAGFWLVVCNLVESGCLTGPRSSV